MSTDPFKPVRLSDADAQFVKKCADEIENQLIEIRQLATDGYIPNPASIAPGVRGSNIADFSRHLYEVHYEPISREAAGRLDGILNRLHHGTYGQEDDEE